MAFRFGSDNCKPCTRVRSVPKIFLATTPSCGGPTQPRITRIENGFEIVADAVPDAGPLGGLVAVLRRCKSTRLLVLAVDLPNMTSEFLGQLLACIFQRRRVVSKGMSDSSRSRPSIRALPCTGGKLPGRGRIFAATIRALRHELRINDSKSNRGE